MRTMWGFLLLGLLTVCRVSQWHNQLVAIQRGSVVQQTLRLSQSIQANQYSCWFRNRGVQYQVKYAVCEKMHLLSLRLGDEVSLTGAWQWWDFSQTKGGVAVKNLEVTTREWPGWTWWWWRRQAWQLQQRLIDVFQHYLPEPEAGLTAGIVLGADGRFAEQFRGVLQQTGTMHIVAASGYNVTVVIGFLLPFLAGWLGRRMGAVATGIGIEGYVLLAGANPPVVRAGLMGMGMLLSQVWGRQYWAGWMLGLVAGGMVLIQPWLVADLSFQLSFLATVGVIVGWRIKPKQIPSLQKYTPLKCVVDSLVEALMTTAAAVIMTLPVSLLAFGQVSWWGLVVNPLVMWLIPPLTYLGFLMVIFGFIWLPLALPLAWIMQPLAMGLVQLLQLFGRVPFGIVDVEMTWPLAIGWWLFWIGVWSIKQTRTIQP